MASPPLVEPRGAPRTQECSRDRRGGRSGHAQLVEQRCDSRWVPAVGHARTPLHRGAHTFERGRVRRLLGAAAPTVSTSRRAWHGCSAAVSRALPDRFFGLLRTELATGRSSQQRRSELPAAARQRRAGGRSARGGAARSSTPTRTAGRRTSAPAASVSSPVRLPTASCHDSARRPADSLALRSRGRGAAVVGAHGPGTAGGPAGGHRRGPLALEGPEGPSILPAQGKIMRSPSV